MIHHTPTFPTCPVATLTEEDAAPPVRQYATVQPPTMSHPDMSSYRLSASSSFSVPETAFSTSNRIFAPCPIDRNEGGTSTERKICFLNRRASLRAIDIATSDPGARESGVAGGSIPAWWSLQSAHHSENCLWPVSPHRERRHRTCPIPG